MGADFSSYLAVGVPAHKIVKNVIEKTPVTKYNPDTGVPYQAETKKEIVYFCGKPTEFKDSIHDWIEDLDLDLCYDYSDGDKNEWIIGKQLCTATATGYSGDKSIIKITPDMIEGAKNEVKTRLAAYGYEGDVDLFLIAHASY